MGLDITFTQRKNIVCPKCGEVVGHTDVKYAEGGGRGWYPLLESLGYYVPPEQRNEENDWYSKDMVLTSEQAEEVYRFVKTHDLYGAEGAQTVIATAMWEKDSVVVNANW